MSVHEKIRFIRQAKNLSQDEMAEKLGICLNAYGNIERGDTDIRLSRLEQIAELFEMPLSQLLGFDEKNVFNMGANNNGTQHNQSYCTIHYPPLNINNYKANWKKKSCSISKKRQKSN